MDFWARDREGKVLVQSAVCLRHWGELQDLDSDQVHPQTLAQWKANNERALRGEMVEGEVELVTRTGERRFFYNVVAPIRHGDAITGLLGVNLDITDRKQTETILRKALEELEEFESVVNRSPVVVFLWRVAERWPVEFVSDNVIQFGYSAEELMSGRVCWADVIYPADASRLETEIAQYLREGVKEFEQQYRLVTRAGEVRWIDNRNLVLTDSAGRATHIQGIALDVTRQKEAEQQAEKEARFIRQLLDLYERDRKLVAFEIHDGIAQPLAGALMNLEASLRTLRERFTADQLRRLEETFHLLQDTLAQARRVMSGLRPATLDDFGVVAAVDHLVREWRVQRDVQIDWSHQVRFDRLAPPLEIALFRIIQEGLANALRHSGSQRVRIFLKQAGDRLDVSVEDEGCGFDPQAVSSSRFGLRGIMERARLLGGQATIQSRPGQGTRISVELPVVERGPEQNSPLAPDQKSRGTPESPADSRSEKTS